MDEVSTCYGASTLVMFLLFLGHLSILVQLMHKDHHPAEAGDGDYIEWHRIALPILIFPFSAHSEKRLKGLVLFCR